MADSRVYLHSPFSESNITKGNNRSLLLQFILSELFRSYHAHQNKEPHASIFSPISSSFYPLDWSSQRGYLNKVFEHSQLLKTAFPEHSDSAAIFHHALLNTTAALSNHSESPSDNFDMQLTLYFKQLYLLLEPFMVECKEDDNFIFFLLKNQDAIHSLTHAKYLTSFLRKHLDEEIDALCESLCDSFHSRGFACLIPEVKASFFYLKNGS